MQPRIHKITGVSLYFLPVQTRVPLKFGLETLTSVTCARVCVRVADEQGNRAEGWGETPLSVQWVWPGDLPYERRHQALKALCREIAKVWMRVEAPGHPMQLGHRFQERVLPQILNEFNVAGDRHGLGGKQMPWLAALVCSSPFDIALHDAYGQLVGRPVYETYGPEFLPVDLSHFLQPAEGADVSFANRQPSEYLVENPPQKLRAWHLVGGLDILTRDEFTGKEPDDGHPVALTDWIERDGLKCLKIKLRGIDADWDYSRLLDVGKLAVAQDVEWLTADFNCTVNDPAYVNDILDRLRDAHPRLHGMILYVEQPFPYDLEAHRIDAHSVSARKPLFLDESAHDWRMVSLGRSLGWTGVALKTCKTQTGALLSACWAKAHGMTLMVQDLTNPMLAQIPHVQLAAHAGTIMGVETNAMQFYPAASGPEEAVHPGLYRRRDGCVDLSTLAGPGFGYRLSEIKRKLNPPDLALNCD
jgi:L-alanine-DL-glutamate epimerase-like enolase superfamily enzyme